MTKDKIDRQNITKTGVRTIITLESDFENIKPLPAYRLSGKGKPAVHRYAFSKEVKAFLEYNGISVKLFPETREPRGKTIICVAGHTLTLIGERTYEYQSTTKDVARIAFHNDINPELKILGYSNTKAKCIDTFEGEEEVDCMDENLNKFKEGN